MFDKIKRNIFFVLGFATVIYFVIIVYSDSDIILETFQQFPISIFLEAIIFIIISIVFKYLRWDIYLRKLKISIDLKSSILIFLSGLIMSISPGKVGELLKAYLIKEKFSISKSRTFPIILAERISEFISLIILVTLGVIIYNYDSSKLIIPIIIICGIFILVLNKEIRGRIFKFLIKSSFLKSRINKIDLFHIAIIELFRPVIFVKIQVVSILAWIAEFYSFYLVISTISENVDLYFTSFIYSVSILIGAISMLPGGIGTTEASLMYQLIKSGIVESSAITATFVIRIVTLWFSVLFGLSAYLIFLKEKEKK